MTSAPPFSESTPPRLDRAMDALEEAAATAEGRVQLTTYSSFSRDDLWAAARLDTAAVRSRLDRVLMGEDPEAGLDALLHSGALAILFPEVFAMVGFGDGEWRHKDVWKHTKQVVRQAVPKLEIRWSALLHDIGKVKTRSISPEGVVHFLGHAEVGTRMFDRMERRLSLFSTAADGPLQATIRFLILNHLRANQYDPGWTDSAVRRFARELGAHLGDLLCLSRADITTKRPEKKRRGLSQLEELEDRIRALAAEDAEVPPLPSGIGGAIIKEFRLQPSPRIGLIKMALEAAVAAGEVAARQPPETYIAFIEAHRDRFGIGD